MIDCLLYISLYLCVAIAWCLLLCHKWLPSAQLIELSKPVLVRKAIVAGIIWPYYVLVGAARGAWEAIKGELA